MYVIRIQQLVGALSLAIGVLCIASATPAGRSLDSRPFARAATGSSAGASSALRIFQKHRLAMRDSIVRIALSQVGTPYRFGGTTPDGFDCSGLVRYVFSRVAVAPPRLAARQAQSGLPIPREHLQPGDLLTFGVGDSVTHVGIYVGQRKYVHASSVAGRVIVSPIDRPPAEHIVPLKGARRLLALGPSPDPRWGGD